MRPLLLAGALATLLPACAAQAPTPADAPPAATTAPVRPALKISTNERFDPAAIAPYKGEHSDTYAYIDKHRDAHLQNVRRWLRQPSISAQNKGISEMAAMVRDDLRKIGFKEAELVPTAGHPGVWGFYDAGAAKTLVVYMMYDVQPVTPSEWKVDPFAAEIVDQSMDRVVMSRGATNQKGPERAFLNALEAVIATKGKPPVNLMVVADGEEELGSPHYPEVINKYADRLRGAAGVIFPFNAQGPTGVVSMSLGVKGIVYFELEARGGSWGGPKTAEIHGSYKAITESPVWRLTQALATLTSTDGNTILVPGYYDTIRQPSDEEQRLVNGMVEAWTTEEPTERQS